MDGEFGDEACLRSAEEVIVYIVQQYHKLKYGNLSNCSILNAVTMTFVALVNRGFIQPYRVESRAPSPGLGRTQVTTLYHNRRSRPVP